MKFVAVVGFSCVITYINSFLNHINNNLAVLYGNPFVPCKILLYFKEVIVKFFS